MTRYQLVRSVAGLTAAATLAALAVSFGPSPRGDAGQEAQRQAVTGRAIPMLTTAVGLEITIGLKDSQQVVWEGDVSVSQGRILSLDLVRGSVKSKVDGTHFSVSARRQMQKKETLLPAILHVSLDAPPSATVTIKTEKGMIRVLLSELTAGTPKTFLEEQVAVERQDAGVRLTGAKTEDDFPALAKGADGTIWLAYIEYLPGPPVVQERILARDFDSLVPKGNGDRVRLMRFDGKAWQPALDVSEGGLNIWRPTVTVDGNGRIVVAWSQQVDGDWEIFYRRYTPGKGQAAGQWANPVRVTRSPGADFHVVATTDSAGTAWLAWQAWWKDNFDILLVSLGETEGVPGPKTISSSRANDWSPAIAADRQGNVYVAWDTYDKGSYDVKLHMAGKENRTIDVAGTSRFEARPSLVCDAQNRVWIAYEEGDEQWGKDYSNEQFDKIAPAEKIGFDKNSGFALYINRTVKVKCLADGKLMQPAGDLQKAFAGTLVRNKSVPRLAVDAGGGIWLLVRHHPQPTGAPGEVWNSFALRYDGKSWSKPSPVANSANLLDNRPALAPLGAGIMAVFSSDNRLRTQNREQDDLFAAVLSPTGATQAMDLVADEPSVKAKVPVVHPDETADVARIRAYRIDAGGKKLRLLRGEFHRHTEYSAHRDIDGLLEDSWRYGLDASLMDWMGNGDHDNGFHHEYMWWTIQKMTDLYQNPPGFVAALTHERSVVYPNGHRNIILPRRGIRPLPRGEMQGTPEKGTPDTKLVYAYLKHFGGICASHTSSTAQMGTDWRDNDPEAEPIVEIYQGHRNNYEHLGAPRSGTPQNAIGGYQPNGHIWTALEKGYRFGFQCSSDHVSTHISYAIVLAEENSRQALIDAFKKRHCYAATDNIILDVRSGARIMGDIFTTGKPPALEITAQGTGPIAKIHVIRDGKYVYTNEPRKREVTLRYTDMDAPAGRISYYYVRVEQADGSLAWGSPMWITYKP